MKMLEYVLENLWTSTSYLFHSYIHDIVHGYDLWLIIYIHLAVFEEIFKKPMDSPQVSSSCVKDTTTVQCSQHLVTMFRIHPSPRVGQSQLHTFFGKVPLFWGVAWWGMIIASSYSLFTRHLSPFWHWDYSTILVLQDLNTHPTLDPAHTFWAYDLWLHLMSGAPSFDSFLPILDPFGWSLLAVWSP